MVAQGFGGSRGWLLMGLGLWVLVVENQFFFGMVWGEYMSPPSLDEENPSGSVYIYI